MAEAGGAAEGKLKVFISYSRKDQVFAEDLVASLDACGFEPYLDRQDIAPGEAWEDRLGRLIEAADTVVFAISPDSVASERCAWEVDRTEALGKRLIPVVWREVGEAHVPVRLKRLNYIFFDGPGTSFGKSLAELVRALNTDLAWIREHTRFGELAARWQAKGRPETLLLRGDDIDEARRWLDRRPKDAPEATEAQRSYIAASAEAESARNSRERRQLEAMAAEQRARARLQRRQSWVLAAVGLLVLALFALALRQSYRTEVREAAVLSSIAERALDEGHYDRAMRIALQGLPPPGSVPWISHWSQALEAKLAGGALLSPLIAQLHHQGPVTAAAFSPDGGRVVTAWDHMARLWDAETGTQIAVLKGHEDGLWSAAFSTDGRRVSTAGKPARVWDISWATLVRGTTLRDRVCAERLTGARAFTPTDAEDPIIAGLEGKSPCDRRGPLSFQYWTRLAADLWHHIAPDGSRRSE